MKIQRHGYGDSRGLSAPTIVILTVELHGIQLPIVLHASRLGNARPLPDRLGHDTRHLNCSDSIGSDTRRRTRRHGKQVEDEKVAAVQIPLVAWALRHTFT